MGNISTTSAVDSSVSILADPVLSSIYEKKSNINDDLTGIYVYMEDKYLQLNAVTTFQGTQLFVNMPDNQYSPNNLLALGTVIANSFVSWNPITRSFTALKACTGTITFNLNLSSSTTINCLKNNVLDKSFSASGLFSGIYSFNLVTGDSISIALVNSCSITNSSITILVM
jgi:hypothetical protein